jgi:hypothetical protein
MIQKIILEGVLLTYLVGVIKMIKVQRFFSLKFIYYNICTLNDFLIII